MDSLRFARARSTSARAGLLLGGLLFALLSTAGLGAQEVLVDFLAPWHYVLGTTAPSAPATAWRERVFDDSAWVQNAPTPIGYGGAAKNIRTTLPTSTAGGYVSVYFRKSINVTTPTSITALGLELGFDDGFVCYVNGVEAMRFNAGAVGSEQAFDALATGSHEFDDEPNTFDLAAAIPSLRAGANTIAFEVHNVQPDSSDIFFNARITASRDVAALCPTGVSCSRSLAGARISWTNHPTANYTAIRVTRNGTPIPGSPFAGTTQTVLDAAGAGAAASYSVIAQVGVFDCPPLLCSTTSSVTVLPAGAEWAFFRGIGEPSPDGGGLATLEWAGLGFDDGDWELGPSGFGYGDGDDATVLDDMDGGYTSVYVRRVFNVASPASLSNLALVIDYDDGFVAYLNGIEVARANAGVAGTVLSFDAVAGGNHEAGTAEAFPITGLVAGDNILAIHGLNTAIDSSDFSLIPTLVTNPDLSGFCPQLDSLVCSRVIGGVELTWTNNPAGRYDRIEVFRNGSSIAGSPFAGDTQAVFDAAGVPGNSYEVVAFIDGFECPALECIVSSELTIVAEGDEWSYFRGIGEPSPDQGAPTTDWTLLGFDDAAWELGPSGFGYGDNDDATVLDDMINTYTSVYCRRVFPSPGAVPSLVLRIDYDDGFIAYLNGEEIARANVVEPVPAFNALASAGREAGTAAFFEVNRALLAPGDNVLAVVGFNTAIDSSDFSLIPELVAGACVPVQGLACTANDVARNVTLTWTAGLHDSVIIRRNGNPIAGSPFAGGVGSAVDGAPIAGDNIYELIGIRGGVECSPVTCRVTCADLFPADLSCVAALSGATTRTNLTWTLRPAGTALVDIVRNGSFLSSVAVGATSFVDTNVDSRGVVDSVTYTIRFLRSDGDPICTITCGPIDLCPQNLVCSAAEDGDVILDWENVVKAWAGYRVLIDGVEARSDIPGNASSVRLEDLGLEAGVGVDVELQPIRAAGTTACSLTCTVLIPVVEEGEYTPPGGGWDYFADFGAGDDLYNSVTLATGNLDGSWIRGAADSWDGSGPLEVGAAPAGDAPGGVGTELVVGGGACGDDATVLRVLDPGDPSAPGATLATEYPDAFDAPNNRTIVLGRGLGPVDANLLREGLTFAVRWRLNPEPPAYLGANPTGDGSPITNGLGQVGIAFVDDGSLGSEGAPASLGFTLNSGDLLQMTSNPVTTLNDASATSFRSLWVTIEDPEGDNTYRVTTYTQGSEETFALLGTADAVALQAPTLNLGSPAGNFLYVALASGSNDADIQIDWIAAKAGVHAPSVELCEPCANNAPNARIAVTPSTNLTLAGGQAMATLNGSQSNDGDGGAQGLTYSWAKVSGPAGDTIASPTAVTTTVRVTAAGVYSYRLRVNDRQSCRSTATALVTLTVTSTGGGETFRRGDVDRSGAMAITDAIALFNFLFIGIGSPPACPDAADADDDGGLGITDGIRILNVLFQGIGVIPAPGFMSCGPDATPDGLGPCDYTQC